MTPADLVKLPSDSLYKWIALSGVAIFLASGYLYVGETIRVETEAAAISAERQYRSAELQEQLKKAAFPDNWDEMSEAEKASAKHKAMPAVQWLLTALRDNEESVLDEKRLRVYHQRVVPHIRQVAGTGMLAGIFMIIFGFAAWYARLQKVQDELLLIHLESERERLKSSGKKRPSPSANKSLD